MTTWIAYYYQEVIKPKFGVVSWVVTKYINQIIISLFISKKKKKNDSLLSCETNLVQTEQINTWNGKEKKMKEKKNKNR